MSLICNKLEHYNVRQTVLQIYFANIMQHYQSQTWAQQWHADNAKS